MGMVRRAKRWCRNQKRRLPHKKSEGRFGVSGPRKEKVLEQAVGRESRELDKPYYIEIPLSRKK